MYIHIQPDLQTVYILQRGISALTKEVLLPTLLPGLPSPTKAVVNAGMSAKEVLGATVSLSITPRINR
jgi:hypothetical protein